MTDYPPGPIGAALRQSDARWQQPARHCGSTELKPLHRSHTFMRDAVVYRCPGGAAEQPVRHTVDTITSDALDQLYAERDEARAAADRYFTNGTKAVEELNWRAHNAEQRAEQAETANARVRAFCDRFDSIACAALGTPVSDYDRALARAADLIRSALTAPKEPRP
jgi:acyl-CoA reductase-like NAD-dependent aldehyde dehydrogenase